MSNNDSLSNKILDPKNMEKLSKWTLDNAPAVIGITFASIVGSFLGLIAGLGLYAFMHYYKKVK